MKVELVLYDLREMLQIIGFYNIGVIITRDKFTRDYASIAQTNYNLPYLLRDISLMPPRICQGACTRWLLPFESTYTAFRSSFP